MIYGVNIILISLN